MANEKIVTLDNLTTYNDKIQDKISDAENRIVQLENFTIPDSRANVLWIGTSIPAGNDYQLFCPDGVHPHSDSTGHSNKVIAGVYINSIQGTLYK